MKRTASACYDRRTPAPYRIKAPDAEAADVEPNAVDDTPESADAPDLGADTERVKRARAGDVRAFEELYRRNVGRVYALCLRMCRNPEEAEELTQEAFIRAWEKLASFRGDSAFSSWLHRLTVNVVLGSWRARGRQREQVVAISEALDDAGHQPQPRLAVDLERAIRALPTGARTVFVLHDVEGYLHRDIAELTGLAVGTCKAQLHRARRLLREALTA